jgi:N-[(2S)-2-amino-2-carboxyethyl]-L-glutamate dehydrogenase
MKTSEMLGKVLILSRSDLLACGGDDVSLYEEQIFSHFENLKSGVSKQFPKIVHPCGKVSSKRNRLSLLTGQVGSTIGTKLLTSKVDNRLIGHPRTHGAIFLFDHNLGVPIAIVEGSLISKMRTIALHALIGHHIPNLNSIGLVGYSSIGRGIVDRLKDKYPSAKIYLRSNSSQSNYDNLDNYNSIISNRLDVLVLASISEIPKIDLIELKRLNPKLILNVSLSDLSESCFKLCQNWIIDDKNAVNRFLEKVFEFRLSSDINNQTVKHYEFLSNIQPFDKSESTLMSFMVGDGALDVHLAYFFYLRAISRQIGKIIDFY